MAKRTILKKSQDFYLDQKIYHDVSTQESVDELEKGVPQPRTQINDVIKT